MLALAVTSAVVWTPVRSAVAFKPFTHSRTGATALADATADGHVTIAGRSYLVPPKVTAALRAWPEYYNAGVIGPDGFPDLIMGQSIIHPENTGMWLRHLLREAWWAQDDVYEPGLPDPNDAPHSPDYTDAEEGQILAFTYGFLTHAAGDVWAHTLINEMSGEVFPGVTEILSDQSAREVALRHILLEGYIGAATQGFDTDPEETVAPFGDVAGDNTQGIPFGAPRRFIYATMVDRDAWGAPTRSRGKVIDFFYGLRDDLQAWVDDDPTPLEDALSEWNDFQNTVNAAFRSAQCDGLNNDPEDDRLVDEQCGLLDDANPGDEGYSGDCNFGGGYNDGWVVAADIAHDAFWCPITLGASLVTNTVEAAWDLVAGTAALLAKQVLNAYVRRWIEDIDTGLQHWGELGLAVTKGLFDPQTKRNAQNAECQYAGADIITSTPMEWETNSRRVCEKGVGTIDAVLWSADDFINTHLLSMLGAPDFVGGLREILDDVATFLDSVTGWAKNPIRMVNTAIKNWAKDIVKAELTARYGLPIEQIERFLDEPTTRIDTSTLSLPATTISVLGIFSVPVASQTLTVLGPAKRAELDGYLGLPTHAPFTPLAASERFNVNSFKAYKNAVTMSKLLLLDGAGMDQVLTDLTGSPYRLYNAGSNEDDQASNIMTTILPTTGIDTDTAQFQWLRMIDGDHSWRQDGLPVFTSDEHGPGGALRAGEGNFPLFESCLLRKKAFRRLFQDWENDDTPGIGDYDKQLDAVENFPDFGDTPSPDWNVSDPPPTWITVGFPHVIEGDTIWVTPRTSLAIDAAVSAGDRLSLNLGWKVDSDKFNAVLPGRSFRLPPLEDGETSIEYTVENDCDGGEPLSTRVSIDRTPPVITFPYAESGAPVYDTNSNLADYVGYDIGDGNGVGVDEGKTRFRLDGRLLPLGFELNTSRLRAGTHTIEVVATDRLGNSATKSATFTVVATLESLGYNLFSYWMSGQIDSEEYELLQKLVGAATNAHDRGRHAVEWKVLNELINELVRQRGERVNFTIALRLENYVRSILAAETSPAQSPGIYRRSGARR